MRDSTSFTQKDIAADSVKLTSKSTIDNELRNALIDPDSGILKPGAMPQVQTATAAGSKQLLDAISKALFARFHSDISWYKWWMTYCVNNNAALS